MEAREILKLAGMAGAVSGFTLAKTAIEDHRIWTHQSVETRSTTLEKGFRIAGAHLTDTKRWASVHMVHHSTPDANLVPFVELADYMDWREARSARAHGQAVIPEVLYGIDPALEIINTDQARDIGMLARKLVEGKYQPKSTYTASESEDILHSSHPRFFYESGQEMAKKRRQPLVYDKNNLPSLHDIDFLLRDPHSPPLHRQGVLGILKYNVQLYKYAERNFEDPAFRPEFLKPDQLDLSIREHRAQIRIAYVAIMAALAHSVNPSRHPELIARNIVLGSATSGAAVLMLLAGGNLTNAFGHAGDTGQLGFPDFIAGKVIPKKDGTYTTNNKLLSPATLDEVGGQEVHHDLPGNIAYTREKRGWKKFKEAPFGTTLETLAKKEIIFKVGKNFNGSDHRPDEPSEAVVMLQKLRAEHL